MGFEKLQKLKEDIHCLASKGKSTQHLQEEKTNLRMKVVEKFKVLYNAKKLRNLNKTLGSHWKHAAEEIVNVLQKIRSEGQENIENLEQMLINTEKAVKRQAENMVKLEHKVLEKQKEVDALNKTLAVTNNENELLKSEVDRYRDQVISMKKDIRKLEEEAIPKEEAELVDNHTQTFLSMVTLISTINEEASSTSKHDEERYLTSVASVVDAATEKHELELKVENLEKKIIEKETQIMMMDRELSEQGRSVYHEPEPVTLSDIPPQPATESLCLEDSSSLLETSQEMKGQSSQTFQVNLNDDAKQKIKELTEDKELLLVEMEKLREQFAQATREIVTLKYADREQPYTIGLNGNALRSEYRPQSSEHLRNGASESRPLEEMRVKDEGSKEEVEAKEVEDLSQPKNTIASEPPFSQSPTTTGDIQYSRQPPQNQYGRKRYSRPSQQLDMSKEDDPGLRQSFVSSESNDIKETQPVTQSTKTLADQGRAQGTVLPPTQKNEFSNYMAFPTKGLLPPQAPKMFQNQKKSKQKDEATQEETILATETEDEHENFVKEIQHYSQYLQGLMQGEITRLSQANEELRRRLSERSLQQFDQLYAHLISPPPLKEPQSSTATLPQGQIRRGRFELLKTGRPSPFIFKNAFATLQSGGRVLHQSSSASEQNVKTAIPFQDTIKEAARYFPGEEIDPFSQPGLTTGHQRLKSTEATSEAVSTSFPSKEISSSKDVSSVNKSTLKSLQKTQRGSSQVAPSLSHEYEEGFVSKQFLNMDQKQQTLPPNVGKLGVTLETKFMPSGGRTAGAYVVGLPQWERRRSQFSAGMEAIEGLTGTSIHFKQAMAQQFAKHFCLSEIKRVKEKEMTRKEIPGKEDKGIPQTEDQLGKSSKDQSLAGLSAQRDLLTQGMPTLFESTGISDCTDLYRGGQAIPDDQLLRPMQTRSLCSIESSHRYLPPLLVHPNQERTNRIFMMLPKAKYPGRGYVVLQTDRFSIYDGRILRNNTEDKPISHRPVPKSYKRRRMELLERQRKGAQRECKDQHTLRNMINFEEGMKFDHNFEESIENSSNDVENLRSSRRREIVKHAQEQLFNPDLLMNKYQGLITNEKS